jgi:dual specificity phosphatase 12
VSRCAKLYDVLFRYRELCGLEPAAHFKHYAYDLTAIDSAMGKSRSATLVMAYLMRKYHISPYEALSQLRESRPVCGPNDGFMEQLEIYHRMLQAPDTVKAQSIYQHWLHNGRPWAASRAYERPAKL